MNKSKLQSAHLQQKLDVYKNAGKVETPQVGWIKTIRTSLGMTLEQMGRKLGITRQSALNIEKREAEKAITLKALSDAGEALGMKLVYGFVPIDGSVDKLIESKARKIATEIVLRTSGTMKLEDQENAPERIKKAIEERTKELIDEMPKVLWD